MGETKQKMKTIIQFKLIRVDEKEFITDCTSFYMKGWINLYLLDVFLDSNEQLFDIGEKLLHGESETMSLEIWEDSDDERTWLDYKILPDDYEVEKT